MIRFTPKTKVSGLRVGNKIATRSYAKEAAEKRKFKAAIVLSGCGHLDGSEITETVSTMIHLQKNGVDYEVFAPDVACVDTVNHVNKNPDIDEERNVLVESSRLSRGKIGRLSDLNETEYQALIFPGGFGVTKHLSNFYTGNKDWNVIPDVARVIKAFNDKKKPMGFICVSPILAARVLGKKTGGNGCKVTVGADKATVDKIIEAGAEHERAFIDEVITDSSNNIFSTPAYMINEANPHQVFEAVGKLVDSMVNISDNATGGEDGTALDPEMEGLVEKYVVPAQEEIMRRGPQ